MNTPRIYVKGTIDGVEYVGHMTKADAVWNFDSYEEISKAEYQSLRKGGATSWGEYETQCKLQGIEPRRRSHWKW